MDDGSESPRPREVDTVADLESDPGDAHKLSTIGRYVILDSVGMGGMGLVCAAYDPKLNRKIALKLLRNAATDEASTAGRNRLFREAQALAKLSHPNVVTVHDVDVFEGQVYIAMEFVEGTTLREWLRERPRDWKDTLAKFILAGRGLAAAHAAEIVHRDFKPSNVLLGNDGSVRVADFGVAKERSHRADSSGEREKAELEWKRRTAAGRDNDVTAEDALIEEIQSNISVDLTVAGRMVGTPAYMAPEQHMGLRVGPYTDQYSFCVSFYEALFGRLPFEGVDRRDQLARMTEGKLPPPPKEGPGRQVPSWLYRVLERGLRAHPSERWASMDALLAALARDPVKRRRRSALIGVGVLGVCAGFLGLYLSLQAEEVDHCPDLAAEVHAHWNEERRREIKEAFEASTKPYAADAARRVIERLDQWTADWAARRVQICEATRVGEQSDELLDVRMYCLDRRARELDAMIELFVEADDEVVERSVGAAHSLGNPAACMVVLNTGEIEELANGRLFTFEVTEMEADLDRAFALASSGKFHESLPFEARVVARARELSHTRILSRALFNLARSQFETGDAEGGEASLREAIELAAELRDAELEAHAWTRMIFYLGAQKQRFTEGYAWALAASSALIRAGSPGYLELRYENSIAGLYLGQAQFEAAAEHYRRALALAREELGESDPNTIRTMLNYGIAIARAGRKDEAEEVLLEVVSRSKDVYGQGHPLLATAYFNLGNLYIVTDKTDEAERAYRQTLAIREAIGGSDASNLAYPLHALAKIARKRGRHEDALAVLERVVAIYGETRGEHSNEVAAALLDIAATQRALGNFEDARASYDQVEAIYAKIFPAGHLHVGGLERQRCELFLDAQLHAEAANACVRALDIDERHGASLDTLRDVHELLVEAETRRGRGIAAEAARARLAEIEAEIEAKKGAARGGNEQRGP